MDTNKTILPAWKIVISEQTTEAPLIFHLDRGGNMPLKNLEKRLK